jgi:hypothetical protein
MAAAALSAVVQTTGGTLDFGESSAMAANREAAARTRKRSAKGHARGSSQSSSSVTPATTGNASATNDGEGGKEDGASTGKKVKSRRSSRREKGKEGDKEREKVKDMVSHVKREFSPRSITSEKRMVKSSRRRGGPSRLRSLHITTVYKAADIRTEDRMLYLFWLPILLFVSFWMLVTALPLITGFGFIYARQITKAIKQRM